MGSGSSQLEMLQHPNADRDGVHIQLENILENTAWEQSAIHLRTIARLHGLPHELCPKLLQLIKHPELPVETLIVIAQALKYATISDNSFEGFLPIWETLLSTTSRKYSDEEGLQHLRSEICLTLCKTIYKTNVNYKLPALSELLKIGNINPTAQSEIARFVEMHNNESTQANFDTNVNQDEYNQVYSTEHAFHSAIQGSVIKPGGIHGIKSRLNNKPNAVKVQSQTAVKCQESQSEKRKLESLNLAKALNARGKSIQKNFQKEVLPPPESKDISDQSWLRNTYNEVYYLNARAVNNETIATVDQQYLYDKMEEQNHHCTSATPEEIRFLIATAFYHISGKQEVSRMHLEGLLEWAFDKPDSAIFCLNIFQMAQRCYNRYPHNFTDSVQSLFKDFLNTNKFRNSLSLKEVIFDIFADQCASGSDEGNYEIFAMAMEKLKDKSVTEKKSRETALKYVNWQSLSSEKSEALFSPSVINTLIDIARDGTQYSLIERRNVVEILENYLEHEKTQNISESSLAVLGKIVDEGKCPILVLMVVRTVLKSIRKKVRKAKKKGMKKKGRKVPPTEFISSLVNCGTNTNEPKLMGMIVIALKDICAKNVPIPNAELLAPLLLNELEISEAFLLGGDDLSEDEVKVPVSAMVAEIILNTCKSEWDKNKSYFKKDHTLTILIQALEAKTLQTRILSAEILYCASKFESFSAFQIVQLKHFFQDPVADVRLFCKSAFLHSLARFSISSNKPIDSELLDLSVGSWCSEVVIHDGKNYIPEINGNIISILKTESGKKNVEFTTHVFELLKNLIADDKGDNLVTESLGIVESLFENYSQKQTKLPEKLPRDLLTNVENILKSCRPKHDIERAERIFQNVAFLGQPVSQGVVKWFCDLLLNAGNPSVTSSLYGWDSSFFIHSDVDKEIPHSELVRLMSCVNYNQDLPDWAFASLRLEMLIKYLYQNGVLWSAKVTNQDFQRCWGKLELLLGQGNKLSVFGMQILNGFLQRECHSFHFSGVLSCLIKVSENGQSLTSDILKGLVVKHKLLREAQHCKMFFRLCTCLLKNNQKLGHPLTSIIFDKFIESETSDRVEMLPFVILFSEKDGILTDLCVQILCKEFLLSEKSQFQSSGLLSVIARTGRYFSDLDLLCKVYFSVLQKNMEKPLVPLAVKGILNVLKVNTKIRFDDNQINLLIEVLQNQSNEEFPTEINLILKHQNLTPQQRMLISLSELLGIDSDEEFVKQLQLNLVNGLISIQSLNSDCLQRFQRVLANSSEIAVKTVLAILSEFLEEETIQIELLPKSLLETLSYILVTSRIPEVTENILSILLNKRITAEEKFWTDSVLANLQSGFEIAMKVLLAVPSIKNRLDEQTIFLLQLESLSTLTEPGQILICLNTIRGKLRKGLKLNEVSTKAMFTLGEKIPTALRALAEITALLILDKDSIMQTAYSDVVCKAVSQIKDDSTKISYELIQAYLIVLQEGLGNFYEKELLTCYKNTKNFEVRKSILKCFLEMSERGHVVDTNCLELLYRNLSSRDSSIRKTCFQTLRKQKSEIFSGFIKTFCESLLMSQNDRNRNIKIQEFFKDCISQANQGKISQIGVDILETFVGLEYWDLSTLNSTPKWDWQTELIYVDFITRICGNSEADKMLLTIALTEIEIWCKNDSSKLFKCLDWIQCYKNCYSSPPFEILDVVESITVLSFEEVKLLFSKQNHELRSSLQELVIVKLLRSKTGETAMQNQFPNIARKMLNILSFQIAKHVIKQVQNLDRLRRLGEAIEKIKKFELNKECIKKMGVQNDTMSFVKFIEESILLDNISRLKLRKNDQNRFRKFISGLFLNNGLHFKVVYDLLTLKKSYNPWESRQLLQVLRILSDHGLNKQVVLQIYHRLLETDWQQWVKATGDVINSSIFISGSSLKSSEDVISDLARYVGKENDHKWKLEMADTIRITSSGDLLSTRSPVKIANWGKKEIFSWATAVSAQFKASTSTGMLINPEFCLEALAVCKVAFQIVTNFQLTPVQIVSIYMGLNKGLKGRLMQVATGSGKSTIVAILAVINALRGLTVDVYTSSPVLAERDARSWATFYSFFGLTARHNSDAGIYTSGKKLCYEADIVYGEISQFQFDILRDIYSSLGTMGGRQTECAIIDEVDSLLVDDLSKLARLSSPVPGMDLLQIFYHLVWHRLTTIERKLFTVGSNIYCVEGMMNYDTGVPQLQYADDNGDIQCNEDVIGYIQLGGDLKKCGIFLVDDINKFIREHLENFLKASVGKKVEGFANGEVVQIPQHLMGFVENQIPKWVENCITAFNYEENVNYIVHQGQIKPVDYVTTGIVQNSTAWSDGLHQFLQIKHNLKITCETITTNFLSNMSLFKMYIRKLKAILFEQEYCDIIGLTGTLGSAKTRETLASLYNVNCVNIPTTHFQKYKQYPDIHTDQEESWLDEIVSSVQTQIGRKRGTLIICETIREAYKINGAIESANICQRGIRLYTHNDSNQEQQIEKIHPGEIFIATNLAGRGTDINTMEIESFGGLHVCLTFLPNNVRVEEQAFGRTSRQGHYGTGQLICILNPYFGTGLELEINKFEADKTSIRSIRDAKGEEELNNFVKNDLKLVTAKDVCFTRFCKFLNETRKTLKEEQQGVLKKFVGMESAATAFEIYILQAIEERWAMFLRQFDDNKIPVDTALFCYLTFQNTVQQDFKSSDHSKVIHSPFYHISIGNDYLVRDSKWTSYITDAQRHFQAAIELDSGFSTGAYVGIGNTLLKGRVGLADRHQSNYRKIGIAHFERALPLVQNEVAVLATSLALLYQRVPEKEDTELSKQLILKMNSLGSYSNCLQSAVAVAKQSLRPVDIIRARNSSSEEFMFPYLLNADNSLGLELDFSDNVVTSTKHNLNQLAAKGFSEVSLKLNNLTVSQDSGEVDQAVNTVRSVDLKEAQVELELINVTSDNLMSMFSKDIYFFGVSQPGALGLISEWKSAERRDKTVDVINIKPTKPGEEPQTQIVSQNKDFLQTEEYLEKQDVNKYFNLIFRNGNKDNCESFHKQIMDLEVHELSSESGLKLLDLISCKSVTFKVFDKSILNNSMMKNFREIRSRKFKGNGIFTMKTLSSNYSKSVEDGDEVHLNFPYKNTHLLRTALSSLNISTRLTLCFESVDTSSLSKLSPNNFTIIKSSSVYFKQQDKYSAEKIIPALRSLHVEYSLLLLHLDLQMAQVVLSKCNLDQENIELKTIKVLTELFTTEWVPTMEISELTSRGIFLLFEFSEKSFIPWFSVNCVVIIAGVQMAVGAALVYTAVGATVGMGLITEGAADLITAYTAAANRHFSWSDYSKQKAVSLTISVVSMGLSSLKDAAKGLSGLGENVVKEALEQAGTSLVTNGRVLNATITATNQNLKTLVAKQIGVAVGEAVVREGLNYAVDLGVKYAMSNLNQYVRDTVEKHLKQSFYTNNDLHRYCALFWALDELSGKAYLESKVKSAVAEVTNPQSDFWNSTWHSIGLPLCRGIFGDSKFRKVELSTAIRLCGIVHGINEIRTAISYVTAAILEKLNKQDATIVSIVQMHCGMNFGEAQTHSENISRGYQIGLRCFKYEFPQSANVNVKEFLTKLNKKQSQFDFKEMDQIIQSVILDVTNHIVKTAETQLIAPLSTWAVGLTTSNLSTWAQQSFIVSADQNVDPNDKSTNMPVSQQIKANAKAKTIAYQQRDMIVKIGQSLSSKNGGKTDKSPIDAERVDRMKKALNGMATDGPADLIAMFTMGKMLNLNLRIVEEDYTPTVGDIDSDAKLVVFEKGTVDSVTGVVGVGHYKIMDPQTGRIENVPSTGNNCGYEVMSKLSGGIPTDQLRDGLVNAVLLNISAFKLVFANREWICSRYPKESHLRLLVGTGVTKRKLNNEVYDQLVNDTPQIEYSSEEGRPTRQVKDDGTEVLSMEIIVPFGADEGTVPSTPSFEGLTHTDENGDKVEYIRGHILSRRAGGSGSDKFNIAAMTRSANALYYQRFEAPLLELKNEFRLTYPEAAFIFDPKITFKSGTEIPIQIENTVRMHPTTPEHIKNSFVKKMTDPHRSGRYLQPLGNGMYGITIHNKREATSTSSDGVTIIPVRR